MADIPHVEDKYSMTYEWNSLMYLDWFTTIMHILQTIKQQLTGH